MNPKAPEPPRPRNPEAQSPEAPQVQSPLRPRTPEAQSPEPPESRAPRDRPSPEPPESRAPRDRPSPEPRAPSRRGQRGDGWRLLREAQSKSDRSSCERGLSRSRRGILPLAWGHSPPIPGVPDTPLRPGPGLGASPARVVRGARGSALLSARRPRRPLVPPRQVDRGVLDWEASGCGVGVRGSHLRSPARAPARFPDGPLPGVAALRPWSERRGTPANGNRNPLPGSTCGPGRVLGAAPLQAPPQDPPLREGGGSPAAGDAPWSRDLDSDPDPDPDRTRHPRPAMARLGRLLLLALLVAGAAPLGGRWGPGARRLRVHPTGNLWATGESGGRSPPPPGLRSLGLQRAGTRDPSDFTGHFMGKKSLEPPSLSPLEIAPHTFPRDPRLQLSHDLLRTLLLQKAVGATPRGPPPHPQYRKLSVRMLQKCCQ
ncbi:neuromedin-B [Erinaceus europaeus]|uniref:Neuromedin-B n=1 Tax=Erinaceus europaeus TaxID=9365 RepID=A0ABM3WGS1_ERIEU|nr:neuromedin-B [Erinaceus europaeus]